MTAEAGAAATQPRVKERGQPPGPRGGREGSPGEPANTWVVHFWPLELYKNKLLLF